MRVGIQKKSPKFLVHVLRQTASRGNSQARLMKLEQPGISVQIPIDESG